MDLGIVSPYQVWTTDITYIRLSSGFVYLVAVMDWFSRYVLSREPTNPLDEISDVSNLTKLPRVSNSNLIHPR